MQKQKILILYPGEDEYLQSISSTLKSQYTEDFDIVDIDVFAEQKFEFLKKKESVFVNPQVSYCKGIYEWCKKHLISSKMRCLNGSVFSRQIKQFNTVVSDYMPDMILSTNFLLVFFALQYKRKINRNCRVFAYNTELINWRSWDNKDNIYFVNNETAFFDAFGKKRYSPALVRKVNQACPKKYKDPNLEKEIAKQSLSVQDGFTILFEKIDEKSYKIIKNLLNTNQKINVFAFYSKFPREEKLCSRLKRHAKKNSFVPVLQTRDDDVLKYYAAADLFVTTTKYVPMKNAGYLGTPILVYKYASSVNILRRLFLQNLGIGIYQTNVEKICQLIETWIENPAELALYRENTTKLTAAEPEPVEIAKLISDESKRPLINIDDNDYTNMLYELATEEKYDTYTTPINMVTQKELLNYDQLRKTNIFSKTYKIIVKSILKLFGPIVDFLGFKIKIEGRKNLKGIKSGITISNHVHYLDCLWNYQALSRKRHVYITGAPFNFKKGFFGATLKAGGFIPIATSFSQKKEFDKYLADILAKGGFVHFYPEQAMWLRYEQSRPLKKGAFYYASKNNVPIIPMVICFRKAKLRKKKAVTIKICAPIYPDPNLSQADNCTMMNNLAQQEYDNAIIEFYQYDKDSYAMNKVQKQSKNP